MLIYMLLYSVLALITVLCLAVMAFVLRRQQHRIRTLEQDVEKRDARLNDFERRVEVLTIRKVVTSSEPAPPPRRQSS